LVSVAVIAALALVAIFVVVPMITGEDPPGIFGNKDTTGTNGEVPETCPLTGVDAEVPNRPALAVKVENAPASRPQSGLEHADIVYEQIAEGGITRFIAVFQCKNADRLGPVRSVRLVDGDVVRQFAQNGSQPLFAHSGGIPEIVEKIPAAGLLDIGFEREPSAYERILERKAPHNLYTTTPDLYEIAGDPSGVPPPVFTYDERVPSNSRPGTAIALPFAKVEGTDSAVRWKWNAGKKAYFRLHGETPHTLETSGQISAKNVVVQFVQTRDSEFVDVTGAPVQEIAAIGQGRAIVFRDGVAVEGTWTRHFATDLTVFKDGRGNVIDLAPGTTWVELFPANIEADFAFS
jgi:hypothetical protein